jgi:hypothetical protein
MPMRATKEQAEAPLRAAKLGGDRTHALAARTPLPGGTQPQGELSVKVTVMNSGPAKYKRIV